MVKRGVVREAGLLARGTDGEKGRGGVGPEDSGQVGGEALWWGRDVVASSPPGDGGGCGLSPGQPSS